MAEVHGIPQCNAAAGFHNGACPGPPELYCSQIRPGQYYCNHGTLQQRRFSDPAPREVVDAWLGYAAELFGLSLDCPDSREVLIALLVAMAERLEDYGGEDEAA